MKLTFLLIVILMMPAMADIHTSNTYYSDDEVVDEDVSLKGMDYTNVVDIYPRMIFASSQAVPGEDGCGSIFDSIVIRGSYSMGATLGISGEDPAYSRVLSTDETNKLTFSYGLTSGEEQAHIYSGTTSIDESLSAMNNNGYLGTFEVTPDSIKLSGSGSRLSFEDKDSYFYYSLSLSQGMSNTEIDAYLTANRVDDTKTTPVIYKWDTYAETQGIDYAKSGFDLAFIAGDRRVDAQIAGQSSNGQNPTVPVSGEPWHVDPISSGTGLTGVETIEDMIRLIQQGVSNSGELEWLIGS